MNFQNRVGRKQKLISLDNWTGRQHKSNYKREKATGIVITRTSRLNYITIFKYLHYIHYIDKEFIEFINIEDEASQS
jgi:hypothetical protein